MTNQEAIETLRANYPDACFEQLREAVDMAINVLTAQEQKKRDCSTCKHKNLCDAFWTQEIEDAPCRECDELAYQKWEPQELTNNSQKLDNHSIKLNSGNDGDLVLRKAAIDSLKRHFKETDVPVSYPGLFSAIDEWLNETEVPSAQPDNNKYEYHYDHTDCIWYRPEARNRCPVTCAQYRDGWNDAMNYIFRDGKGYRPYRRDERYE